MTLSRLLTAVFFAHWVGASAAEPPPKPIPYFKPPKEFANDFGRYRSPPKPDGTSTR